MEGKYQGALHALFWLCLVVLFLINYWAVLMRPKIGTQSQDNGPIMGLVLSCLISTRDGLDPITLYFIFGFMVFLN